MIAAVRRLLLTLISLFPEKVTRTLIPFLCGRLKEELSGKVTDRFVELLLGKMELAFLLSRSYRKNIENFHGRYLFTTADDRVAAAAVFSGGRMKVLREPIDDWQVRVTFKNPAALWSFLFSRNQDILQCLLADEVEVDGNMNYLYKFGFMARDLARRLKF